MKNNAKKEKNPAAEASVPEFEIKNFGPIAQGKIQLKNLTIFIGPNSSGKSYAAMLIKAFYDALADENAPRRLRMGQLATKLGQNLISNDYAWENFDQEKLRNDLLSLTADEEYRIENSIIHQELKESLKKLMEETLINSLNDTFASKTGKLSRYGNHRMSLSYKLGEETISFLEKYDNLFIEEIDLSPVNIYIRLTNKNEYPDNQYRIEKTLTEYKIVIILTREAIESSQNLIKDFIKSATPIYITSLIHKLYRTTHYLPAFRAGLLSVRKELSSALIRKKEVTDTAGVIREFLGDLEGIVPDVKKEFFKKGREAEKNLTGGEIIINDQSFGSYNLTYKKGSMEIPISNASSTVNEIAPLVIYLKHIVSPGDILVIEEPESSLHPAAQREMARLIASLVRSGLKILITTHSDYLLEQLGNLVMMSGLDQKRRRERYGTELYLAPEEVSAYLFKYNNRNKAYRIEELPVTGKDGISMEEQTRVAEELYDESVNLESDIEES
ncbi:MAG: AAA family ATPase [bacterium]